MFVPEKDISITCSQGSKNIAEEGDERGLELEDGEETYKMVLPENVNTLEPLNSQYHWSPAQNPHKIKPVNVPGEREKELLRPHSWLSSYWQ